MKQYFADTFYFLALLNPRDEFHLAAQSALSSTVAKLITTRWDSQVEISSASEELFHRGMELYRNRPDKDWPLTDCISFTFMDDLGIKEALTGDRHFRQAGFVPLLAREVS
jgi:predicted nucleic acid-binding protein